MTIFLTIWFTLTALILLALGLHWYSSLKHLANGILALAVKELNEALSSLLKSADELPPDVLRAVETITRSAFGPKAHWTFYRILKLSARGTSPSTNGAPLQRQISQLRPDLQALLVRAASAWLTILCNRSILVGYLISTESRRLQLKHGHLPSPEDREDVMKVLPGLMDPRCAA